MSLATERCPRRWLGNRVPAQTVGAALLAVLFCACGPISDFRQEVVEPWDSDQSQDAAVAEADESLPDVIIPVPVGQDQCKDIYADDLRPTFEIEISDEAWEALEYEWEHGEELEATGGPLKVYHPVDLFRYNDEQYFDVMIRVKGSPFHWPLSPDKMQFNISFREINRAQRFHGVRKLLLDAPDYDQSLLHDRLGMSVFHDMGVPAPCVNHARLVVNGDYYGVFVNIEHVDQEFLARNFGMFSGGNLYKYGAKKTHEDDPDMSDLEAFQEALDIEKLDKIMDLDEAVLEWAGEAIFPDVDGFWSGSDNYYLYNHPQRTLLMIPWDLDDGFEHMHEYTDPVDYHMNWGDEAKAPQFDAAIGDPYWRQEFLDALDAARAAYDPAVIQPRIDRWAAQIADAMKEDPNKPFSTEEHQDQVETLREFVALRSQYYDDWKLCATGAGERVVKVLAGYDFSFWKTRCNWQTAQAECQKLGGALAVPVSQAEHLLMAAAVLEVAEDWWWVGATDQDDEGDWVDTGGQSLPYEPWDSGQPEHDDHDNCAAMSYGADGAWHDKECGAAFPSVCRLP